LETCGPNEKTERRARLETLLQAALSQAGIRSLSQRGLIEILAEPYHEFKRAKRREERAKLPRLR
jgi:hypothetical protein